NSYPRHPNTSNGAPIRTERSWARPVPMVVKAAGFLSTGPAGAAGKRPGPPIRRGGRGRGGGGGGGEGGGGSGGRGGGGWGGRWMEGRSRLRGGLVRAGRSGCGRTAGAVVPPVRSYRRAAPFPRVTRKRWQ